MKSTTYKGLGTGRKDEEDEDREGVGEDGCAQTQQETHGLKAERYWKRIIN